jgi:malonate transporter and related proteins
MLNNLTVTTPFFLLILGGYLATRRGLLPINSIAGLNSFVLFFALPCMLFRFGSTTPINQLFNFKLALVYLLCSAVLVAVAVVISRRAKLDWNNTAFGALVAVFPNTGFMGVPLLVGLLGQAAAGPVIVTIFLDLVIVTSVCVGMSKLNPHGGQQFASSIRQSLRGMASNPMPWSICLGGLASAIQFQPPILVASTIELLANAASPVALFTIGALLARSAILEKTDTAHVPLNTAIRMISGIKLIAHPVLILIGFYIANALGADVDPFVVLVAVLVGALPSASNVTILAERFHADSARVAKIVLITTTIAFFTFPATIGLLNQLQPAPVHQPDVRGGADSTALADPTAEPSRFAPPPAK